MTLHKTLTVLLKCGFATDCATNYHSVSDVYGMKGCGYSSHLFKKAQLNL